MASIGYYFMGRDRKLVISNRWLSGWALPIPQVPPFRPATRTETTEYHGSLVCGLDEPGFIDGSSGEFANGRHRNTAAKTHAESCNLAEITRN